MHNHEYFRSSFISIHLPSFTSSKHIELNENENLKIKKKYCELVFFLFNFWNRNANYLLWFWFFEICHACIMSGDIYFLINKEINTQTIIRQIHNSPMYVMILVINRSKYLQKYNFNMEKCRKKMSIK